MSDVETETPAEAEVDTPAETGVDSPDESEREFTQHDPAPASDPAHTDAPAEETEE